MAYDEQGRYYFSPEFDSEDAETLADFDKQEHARQYRGRQAVQQHAQNDFNQIFTDAMQDEGIDPKAYQDLINKHPDFIREVTKESIKTFARGVKSKKKQPAGAGEHLRPDEAKSLALAREKRDEGKELSEDDLLRILPSLIK